MLRNSRASVCFFLAFLFFGFVAAHPFNFVGANFEFPPESLPSIAIRSDGSIEPLTAPIVKAGDVYTLTSNITDATLRIERDNILVDSVGYTISSNNKSSPAIYLMNRNNVTIKNTRIAWFCSAHLSMGGCTNCAITGNTFETVSGGAITMNGCNYCTVANNTIYNSDLIYTDLRGESVYCSDNYNTFSGNRFIGGKTGLILYGTGNVAVNNVFTDLKNFTVVNSSGNPNTIENNTIVDSGTQPSVTPTSPSSTNSPEPSLTSSSTAPTPVETNLPSDALPSPSAMPSKSSEEQEQLQPVIVIVVAVAVIALISGVCAVAFVLRRKH